MHGDAVRSLQQLAEHALDQSPLGVVLFDRDGRVFYENATSRRLLGGVPFDARAVAFDRAGGGEFVHVDHVELPSGEQGDPSSVELWLGPLRDTDGVVVGVTATFADSTARRTVEAQLDTAREELQRKGEALERSNADLEQFAYVASHDLAEPLRVIAGFVRLLQRRYAGRLDAEADEYIEFAVEGCERLRQLIDDVLSYSRVAWHEPELESVDCNDVLRRALQGLATAVGDAHAEVRVGELPVLLADPRRLTQLFQNLISNAIKFARPDAEPLVEIHAEASDDGCWRFTVADNGIGIESQHRERAFRMFQRLHARDEYAGTGIGLALCQRIVQRHHGRIWIEDRAGGGTAVLFTLPTSPPRL